MKFIQDNGGLLAVGAVAMILLGAYAEWRIDRAVSDALASAGIVPEAKIEAMEGDIADNKEYIRKTEDKVERIVDILLEE